MKQLLLPKLIAIMLTCSAFISCSSVKWVGIDRLVPAKMDLSEQVRRVAVLNNQPAVEDSKASEEFFLSSQAVADTLAQYLADAAYFDEVVVSDTVCASNWLIDHKGRELRPTMVDELCRKLGVDMLVTVDYVSFVLAGVDFPFATGTVKVFMKCYQQGNPRPVASIRRTCEMEWEHWNYLKPHAVCVAAVLALPTLVPQWQSEQFPFYTGANVGQRDAAVYVREGNWEGAATLWRQQLNHKNRRRQMEAHLNMAVFHEVTDDNVTMARDYAQKALKLSKGEKDKGKDLSYDTHLITEYMKEMERRGRNLERVKQQMHRFSNDF